MRDRERTQSAKPSPPPKISNNYRNDNELLSIYKTKTAQHAQRPQFSRPVVSFSSWDEGVPMTTVLCKLRITLVYLSGPLGKNRRLHQQQIPVRLAAGAGIECRTLAQLRKNPDPLCARKHPEVRVSVRVHLGALFPHRKFTCSPTKDGVATEEGGEGGKGVRSSKLAPAPDAEYAEGGE